MAYHIESICTVFRGSNSPTEAAGYSPGHISGQPILAKLSQEAMLHTNVLTNHLADLGFVLHKNKCFNVSSEYTLPMAFAGLKAQLSTDRVKMFRACLSHFPSGEDSHFQAMVIS